MLMNPVVWLNLYMCNDLLIPYSIGGYFFVNSNTAASVAVTNL